MWPFKDKKPEPEFVPVTYVPGHALDKDGFHKCRKGGNPIWDGYDLSCGRGPISGEYCRPS